MTMSSTKYQNSRPAEPGESDSRQMNESTSGVRRPAKVEIPKRLRDLDVTPSDQLSEADTSLIERVYSAYG